MECENEDDVWNSEWQIAVNISEFIEPQIDERPLQME